MSDVIVGRISNRITYDFRSPRTRADSRNSRLRSERVCERSCLAPYDQPSTPSTTTSVRKPAFFSYAAITMMSRKIGSTRHASVTSEWHPAVAPAKHPAETATRNGESRGERPDGQRDHERAPGSPNEL